MFWLFWTATLYVHFRGLLPPDKILPVAKFTLRPSLAFSYSIWQRYCMHGSPAAGVSQTAAWCKEWNYRTFAEGASYIRQGGHHIGHRPTFYSLFLISLQLRLNCLEVSIMIQYACRLPDAGVGV